MNKSVNPTSWWSGKLKFPSMNDLENLHDFALKRSGWIYAIHSPEHLDWGFKIGRTKRNPFERAKELAHAGSPHSYEVSSAVLVINAPWAERKSHQALREFHYTKEWFKCSQEKAIDTINSIKELEQAMLSKYFNIDLLVNGNQATFVSNGFYPDEMISTISG